MGTPFHQVLLTFAFSSLLAVLLTPVMIVLSRRFNLMDRPGIRKVHKNPLPRLGGVALYFATWISWVFFALLNPDYIPYESLNRLWALFGASTLVWLLGIYDDLKGSNAWQKLIVQFIAAVWVVSEGVQIGLLSNPFGGGDFVLNPAWAWALSVAWIVIVTNAINLIDGLDGLASGVCFITALTIFFIAQNLDKSPHLPLLVLCLAGACLGFLFFNFSPARIFLGDSGSLFLGFMLACLSMQGTSKRSAAIIMFGPPIILALPMLDTALAIFRRFLANGGRRFQWKDLGPRNLLQRFKQVFQADQKHIHHALLDLGLSHRRAVIILYFVATILGISAYRVSIHNYLISTFFVFLVLALSLVWLRKRVRGIKKSKYGL